MKSVVQDILKENARRNAAITAKFNPVTGEGSILEREEISISDFPFPKQFLPLSMLKVPLVKQLIRMGSLKNFIEKKLKLENTPENREAVIKQFIRIRFRHDFAFWASVLAFIKAKGGGEDIRFRLNRSQRKLITAFETERLAGRPIRLVLLKARQWGGSTATQIYMAWLQLVHRVGLNSLIVGHVKDSSIEVKDMFNKLINNYPAEMLHRLGETYAENEQKMEGVGMSGNIHRIIMRNCKIKIGTAEKPDSARGGDYNLVHCTEVGLWKTTEGKSPEDIVRSATSGVLLKPYTMIVYESTANGTGNFFQREYDAAKRGLSQFKALFVAWHEIEQYAAPIEDMESFARTLYERKDITTANSEREEPGAYLWSLWNMGATLEAINWYVSERSKYNDHGDMASEYPSDDIEAFVHSGARVFDKYKVAKLRGSCRAPKYIGEVYADADEGERAFSNVRFNEDPQGQFWIWAKPEIDIEEEVLDRYLVVVDIGGRGHKADYSVVCVFDRLFQIDGGCPSVVAQWYGHIDMDVLSWKAAQIAAYYDNALLVIESNTLETHDKERQVDGDQSGYILNQIKGYYDNLYARAQSEEEIREQQPRKYGFHTNVATKPKIISTLVKVIREGLYTERDERCLDEYLTYERKKNGSWGAILGKHDDLLMTRAIGLHIAFYEMPVPSIITRERRSGYKRKTISEATI